MAGCRGRVCAPVAAAAAGGCAAVAWMVALLGLHLCCAAVSGFEVDALPGWLGETHETVGGGVALKQPQVIKLSWRPRAFLYRGFLSQAECDHVIRISTPSMERSTVVDPATGKSVVDEYRSSYGTFINKAQDSVIAEIEERIARWTFLPVENQEAMQVLRYGIGQKYDPHHDFFDENDAHNQQGGHRYATVLMYLSEVGKGGETVFPDSEKDTVVKDDSWSECGKRGVGVRPVKGDALLFFSLHPNATADFASLHAGCPVVEGEKWSATKWIHVRSFEEMSSGGGGNTFSTSSGGDSDCTDDDENCQKWAGHGECDRNPVFMKASCRKSCGEC